MPHITVDIDDSTEQRLRDAAALHQMSQDQFVTKLVHQATAFSWPLEAQPLPGAAPDFPLAETLRADLPPC